MPSSSKAMPNLDVAVAVLLWAIEPAPTWGLIRMPIREVDERVARIVSMRASSWKLSVFTATPSSSARRSSARVFSGEPNTICS